VVNKTTASLFNQWRQAGWVGLLALLVGTATLTPAAELPSFADVAERVSPAVVNVQVRATADQPLVLRGHQGMPDHLPVPEFFRRFFEEHGGAAPPQMQGQGSGFIIDADGLVVTNNHVIEGATEITVVLNDGSSHVAQIVGYDEKSDLALLKINAEKPLTAVEFGDSTRARVGDWVLAVGNPFGLGGSVNAGIISARGRDIHAGPYDDYLQIDAAINRGNSGGPLFDTSGMVIGVNTAIFSPTGGNVGIGFAIPAETVKQVVSQLRKNGHVERGWLGIQIQAITPELAAGLGLNKPGGVLVAEVIPNGPASESNLRAGDVIVSVNGQPIETPKDLPKKVAATPAGTRINLEVWRHGKPWQVALTVGVLPDKAQLAQAGSTEATDADASALGMAVVALTPALSRQQGFDPDLQGVFVARVQPGSSAARAGIVPGSVIAMVSAEPVDSPASFKDAVRKAMTEQRQAIILLVEQGGQALFVAVPL
jgi:serine protease Do